MNLNWHLCTGSLFWCNFEGSDTDWCDMEPRDSWLKQTGPTPFPDTGPSQAYDGDVFVYQTAQEDGSTHR
jgi:hypothetical protein